MLTDDTNPTLSGMPSDITQNTDSGLATGVVTWTEPTAGDNSGMVTLTSDFDSGDAFPIGDTLVTYTAVDSMSNLVTDIFTVTVQGTEK